MMTERQALREAIAMLTAIAKGESWSAEEYHAKLYALREALHRAESGK